jgi:diamine N-acetyltransferase
MIDFCEITWDNWEECIGLRVAEEQDDFIADNIYSIAESYVALLNDELPPMTYAIYNDNTMIVTNPAMGYVDL